jgi:hypothetical protein
MSSRLVLSFGVTALALVGCGPREELVTLQPAQLELSIRTLEFDEIPKGEKQDKVVVVSNAGDVALGLKEIYLATEKNPRRGHSGSYRLLWNCGDVEVPNLDGEEEATEKGRPSLDSGEESVPEDSAEDTGGGGNGGSSECVVPPGGRLAVKVRFQPTRAGENWDSLVVETYGIEADSGTPIEERVYRDLDTTWKQVFLKGIGGETTPRPLVTPRNLDFGYVFPGQGESRYVSIRNAGDGELRIAEVALDVTNCSPGFSLVYGPERNALVSGDTAKVAEVRYDAATDRAAQCRLRVRTDDPQTADSEATTEVLLVANSGSNIANEAPRVVIHGPKNGYQHRGMSPIPLELTVFDTNEPADGLYCKVRSGLQGIKDGRPALADCRPEPGNPSGHQIVPVPVDFYVEPGLEVLLVRVTDSSGVTREASVPVLINSSFPTSDDDGDGFGTSGANVDCDDTNPRIHPFAAEAYDGRDNDCDRLIDEGTDGFDDDGDGMSEAQGDCDDANPDSYRGAPELRDRADNDCDGTADENTTSFDDDGDGYTELERDCNDRDPTVSPGGVELCGDNVDNDCDQILDEADPGGCRSTDTVPMIVGRMDLSRTSIELGQTIAAFVQVYESDGDEVSYQWEIAAGVIDDDRAQTINWTAPPELSDPDLIGEIFTLNALAADPQGNQDWTFEEIWMYPEGELDIVLSKVVEVEGSGCSNTGAPFAWTLAGFGLVLAAGRRRRR